MITTWQPELPTYSDFEQRRSDLWQRPAWARGVLVDDSAAKGGPPLHVKMQHVSACSNALLHPFVGSHWAAPTGCRPPQPSSGVSPCQPLAAAANVTSDACIAVTV